MESKHPSALRTVEELSAVYEMTGMQDDPDEEEKPDWIDWLENETGHFGSIAFLIKDEWKQIEQYVSTSSFFHGTGTDKNNLMTFRHSKWIVENAFMNFVESEMIFVPIQIL